MIDNKDTANSETSTSPPLTYRNWFKWFAGRLRHPLPVNIETILKSAKKGTLEQFLTAHYSVYYDQTWRAHLRLCQDLVEAGYLKAEFEKDSDGGPIFLKPDPRITIAGHEYLERIRQGKLWWQFLIWSIIFLSGMLSSFISESLRLFFDVYAKKHGLQ